MRTLNSFYSKIKQQFRKIVSFSALILLSAVFGSVIVSNPLAYAQSGCDINSAIGTPSQRFEKSKLSLDETFWVYADLTELPASCASATNVFFKLELSGNFVEGDGKSFPPIRIEERGVFYGFKVNVQTSLKELLANNYDAVKTRVDSFELNQIGLNFKAFQGSLQQNGKFFGSSFKVSLDKGNGQHQATDPGIPKSSTSNVPPGSGTSGGTDISKVQVKITANTEYRVVETDNLTIPYKLEWGSDIKPSPGDKITIGINTYDFERVYTGLNYDQFDVPGCSAIISAQSNCSFPQSSIGGSPSLPFSGETVLSWSQMSGPNGVKLNRNLTSEQIKQGVEIGSKGFTIFPIIRLDSQSLGNSDYGKPSGAPRFTVKVYASQESIVAACKKDHPDPDTYCNDPKNLSGAGTQQSSTPTGNNKDSREGGGSLTSTIVQIVRDIIAAILGFIRLLIYAAIRYLIVPLLTSLLSIHTYTDAFAKVILPGWTVIRNIGNIFFVVVLMVIGVTTLFRVEGYQYKDLLVKLVIAAVLVNFSLVIAQGILAVAETVQFQFLPADSNAINELAYQLILQPASKDNQFTLDPKIETSDAFASLLGPFFSLALATGSAIVLGALVIFLIIRMVALLILLMVSPIPYIADILPATRSYKKQWWTLFLRYAFFTPIMAFFLNITAYISQQKERFITLKTQSGAAAAVGDGDFANFFYTASTNVIILVFLIASIKVAKEFGIAGADTFTNIANKGIKLPAVLARAGAERTFEGASNVSGIQLDPRVWAQKFQEYQKKSKAERLEKLETKGGALQYLQKKAGLPGNMGLNNPAAAFERYASFKGGVTAIRSGFDKARSAVGFGSQANIDKYEKQKKDLELKVKILTKAEKDELTAKNSGFAAQAGFGKTLTQPEALKVFKNINTDLATASARRKNIQTAIASPTATPEQKKVLEDSLVEFDKNNTALLAQRDSLQAQFADPDKTDNFELQKEFLESAYFNPALQADPNYKVNMKYDVGREAAEVFANRLTDAVSKLKQEETQLRGIGNTAGADEKAALAVKIKDMERSVGAQLVNKDNAVIKIDPKVFTDADVVAAVGPTDVKAIQSEGKTKNKEATDRLTDDTKNRAEAKVTGDFTKNDQEAARTNLTSINEKIAKEKKFQDDLKSRPSGLKSDEKLRRAGETEATKDLTPDDRANVEAMGTRLEKALAKGVNGKFEVTAIIKEMARNGNFVEVMNKTGYNADYDGIQNFTKEVLQKKLKFSDEETKRVLGEIGSANSKAGLAAFAKLVDKNPDGSPKFFESQAAFYKTVKSSLDKLNTGEVAKMDLSNFGVKDKDSGKFEFSAEGLAALKKLNTEDKQKTLSRSMDADTAKALMSASKFSEIGDQKLKSTITNLASEQV